MDAALLSLVTQSSRHSLAAAGSSVVWGRDQDVALDFPTLAKALTKVARGEVRTGGLLVRARGHACLRSKRAPCQGLNSLQGRRSAAWRGVQGSNTWWCIMRVCVCGEMLPNRLAACSTAPMPGCSWSALPTTLRTRGCSTWWSKTCEWGKRGIQASSWCEAGVVQRQFSMHTGAAASRREVPALRTASGRWRGLLVLACHPAPFVFWRPRKRQ